jgi:uncharacterized protein (TIGR03546 family)
MPIVPLTRFNESIVMGSGLLAFVLVIPLYFAFKKAVIGYRVTIVARYQQTKIWKAWAGTTFYKLYNKYIDKN